MSNEKKGWFYLIIIECLHCGWEGTIEKFHEMYKMKVNDEPGKMLYQCPLCNKIMELKELHWETYESK